MLPLVVPFWSSVGSRARAVVGEADYTGTHHHRRQEPINDVIKEHQRQASRIRIVINQVEGVDIDTVALGIDHAEDTSSLAQVHMDCA